MELEGKHDFESNRPSQVTTVPDISYQWKLGEGQSLEFNSFSPALFEILNRRTPAFYEIMNEAPACSFETNVLRTDKTATGQNQWEEVSNTAGETEFAGSFEPLNRL